MTGTQALGPGSVVDAEVTVEGRTARRRFFRTRYDPAWVAEQDVRDRSRFSDADLRDPVVLFAAPADTVAPTPTAAADRVAAFLAHHRANHDGTASDRLACSYQDVPLLMSDLDALTANQASVWACPACGRALFWAESIDAGRCCACRRSPHESTTHTHG